MKQNIIVSGIVAAVFCVLFFVKHNEWQKENDQLQSQISLLQAANENLSNQLAQARAMAAKSPDDDQRNELLRLRGEVARLRQQAGQRAAVAEVASRHNPAPPATAESTDPIENERRAKTAKLNDARGIAFEALALAKANQGQLSSEIDDANLYTDPHYSGTNRFEVVYRGKIDAIGDPATTVIIRERQAWQTVDGQWAKAYGFADGHAELHTESSPDFTTYEGQHIVVVDQ